MIINVEHCWDPICPSQLTRRSEKLFLCTISLALEGGVWINELGSWITLQLIQAYRQCGVGSRPAL
jgi:hypothetical protein